MEQKADSRTHVLISLCGTSPAVITETVFSLARSGDPPGKVVVITTFAGAACLREESLNRRISDLAAELKKHHVSESFLSTRGRGIYGIGLASDRIHIRMSAGSPESCSGVSAGV